MVRTKAKAGDTEKIRLAISDGPEIDAAAPRHQSIFRRSISPAPIGDGCRFGAENAAIARIWSNFAIRMNRKMH